MNTIDIKKRQWKKSPTEVRAQGMIPGVLYGPTIKNDLVKMSKKELKRITAQDGVIYQVPSKNGSIMVKFHEIQRDPLTNEALHFSLVQMPRGVENQVKVPIQLKGIPAGSKQGGVLVVLKDNLTLHGAPRSIPKEVTGDVSRLKIGDKLVLDDLKLPQKADALEDKAEVIAVCQPPAKETPRPTPEADPLNVDPTDRATTPSYSTL